jgi:oligosaccharide repeat unit polymerase
MSLDSLLVLFALCFFTTFYLYDLMRQMRRSIRDARLGSLLLCSLIFFIFIQGPSLYMLINRDGLYAILNDNHDWRFQFALSAATFNFTLHIVHMLLSPSNRLSRYVNRKHQYLSPRKFLDGMLNSLYILYLLIAAIVLIGLSSRGLFDLTNFSLVDVRTESSESGSLYYFNQAIRIVLPFIALLIIYYDDQCSNVRTLRGLISRFLSYLSLFLPFALAFFSGQRSSLVMIIFISLLFLCTRIYDPRLFVSFAVIVLISSFAAASVLLSRVDLVNNSVTLSAIVSEILHRIFLSQANTTASMYQLYDSHIFTPGSMTLNTLETYSGTVQSNSSLLFSLIHPHKIGSASYSPVADFFYDFWYAGPILMGIIYGFLVSLLDSLEFASKNSPVRELSVIFLAFLLAYSLLGGGILSLPYQGMIAITTTLFAVFFAQGIRRLLKQT